MKIKARNTLHWRVTDAKKRVSVKHTLPAGQIGEVPDADAKSFLSAGAAFAVGGAVESEAAAPETPNSAADADPAPETPTPTPKAAKATKATVEDDSVL